MFNIYKVLFKRSHLIGIQVHVLCATEYNCIRLGRRCVRPPAGLLVNCSAAHHLTLYDCYSPPPPPGAVERCYTRDGQLVAFSGETSSVVPSHLQNSLLLDANA